MAYTIPEILIWAQMSQPLARRGEAKKKARGDTSADINLDMKIYLTRLDVLYEYNQDPSSTILFTIGNYLYALCFPYVLTAQSTTAGGGSITPVTPSLMPDPYDFVVNSSSSFILAGATSKTFPSNWIGFNILFVRNHVTQSILDDGNGSTYYSWDRNTATLTLFNGAAVDTEVFQIFPL